MEPVSGGPPSPPVMPPPVFAAPVAQSLYRQAFRIVKANPRAMLLPLLVTEVPVAIILAITTFVLYQQIYPESSFGSVSAIQDDPTGLLLGLLVMNGVFWLFSLVGLAATAVAAKGVINGKQLGLAGSLDPAFTRMGGLLGLGFTFYGFVLIVAIGVIPAIFFIIRFGMALHAFILDGQTVGQSLRSSWTLLRGKMLRFTGMLLIFAGAAFLVMLVVTLVLSLLTGPFMGAEPSRDEEVLLVSTLIGVAGFAAVPVGAFVMTTMTLFYLRERKGSGIA